jgi:hypothetical protein
MRKMLRFVAMIALAFIIGYTFVATAEWNRDEVSGNAVAFFVVSEQSISESFYDRARALDRVGRYQAGLDGIHRALHARGIEFKATTIPKYSELLTLQRLFAVELKRATLASNSHPWPLAHAAVEAMCESFHDSHTGIMQSAATFSPLVTSRVIDENLGLLAVRAFNAEDMHRFPDVVRELDECRGIVLDLRGSVGGDLSAMYALASCLVPRGTPLFIVTNDYIKSLSVTTGSYQTRLPMVVLVNGESYSAAEMLAEVLQRTRRAPLIGLRTAGHLGVATEWTVGGVLMRVTTHTHHTFYGARLEGIGVTPDIVIADEPTQTGGRQFDRARTELERLIAAQEKK